MNLVNNDFGQSTVDNLIADSKHPIDVRSVVIASGQGMLSRGTVIGILTASGKGAKVDNSKTDGTQTANCILTDDIDATSGDVTTTAYISGSFNRGALVFGGDDTAAEHETKLRELGIILKDMIGG